MILCQMTTIHQLVEILDTDTRSIEMHRIKYALVESRNKSKLLASYLLPSRLYIAPMRARPHAKACNNQTCIPNDWAIAVTSSLV